MKYIYTFWIIIYLVTPTYLPFCKLKATFYITKKQNHQPSKLIYLKSSSINCIYMVQHLQQWSNIIYFKSPSINCITNKQNQQPSVLIYFKTQSSTASPIAPQLHVPTHSTVIPIHQLMTKVTYWLNNLFNSAVFIS